MYPIYVPYVPYVLYVPYVYIPYMYPKHTLYVPVCTLYIFTAPYLYVSQNPCTATSASCAIRTGIVLGLMSLCHNKTSAVQCRWQRQADA